MATHSFLPGRITQLVDLVFASFLEWSAHTKFSDAFVDRISKAAPEDNRDAAARLTRSVKQMLKARKEAHKGAAWAECEE